MTSETNPDLDAWVLDTVEASLRDHGPGMTRAIDELIQAGDTPEEAKQRIAGLLCELLSRVGCPEGEDSPPEHDEQPEARVLRLKRIEDRLTRFFSDIEEWAREAEAEGKTEQGHT